MAAPHHHQHGAVHIQYMAYFIWLCTSGGSCGPMEAKILAYNGTNMVADGGILFFFGVWVADGLFFDGLFVAAGLLSYFGRFFALLWVVFVGGRLTSDRVFPFFGRRCSHHETLAFRLDSLVGCWSFFGCSWPWSVSRTSLFEVGGQAFLRFHGDYGVGEVSFLPPSLQKNGFFCWLSFGFFGAVLCSFLAFFSKKTCLGVRDYVTFW